MRKKNFLFIFLPFFAFSQQVMKKISDYPDYITVTFYVCVNGTDGNFVGNLNADSYVSGAQNKYYFYDQTNGNYYYRNETYNTYPTRNAEYNICNKVLKYNNFNSRNTISNNYLGNINNQSLYGYDVGTPYYDDFYGLDSNSDLQSDVIINEIKIPKKYKNGFNNLLNMPLNLWVSVSSVKTNTYTNGVFSPYFGARIVMKFDGSNWVEQQYDWNNALVDGYSLRTICQTNLNSNETNSRTEILISPNPTNGIIKVRNNQNKNYKIFDYSGKLVQLGNIKSDNSINLENLKSGQYLVQVENQTFKIIKN